MSREINNNMKRRNVDGPKLRRTLKKSRLTDSMNNGSLIYLKLLMAWALLMIADFLLGFRFEYLWPFWLLVRSIYDSFRYQGVAFSVFFVCITVTSDLVCFLFIPVQWLFFLASTYVWVQYVWHADRGICLPTVALWLLFIYVEASVRLKELTNSKGFPFTLDLCRPFAAHCIGYPVVTLGFGVKTYVGYKFRLRKQREVARENEFYAQLLTEALPQQWDSRSREAEVRQRYSEDEEDDGDGLDACGPSRKRSVTYSGVKGTKRVKSRRSTPHGRENFPQITHQSFTKESQLNVQNDSSQHHHHQCVYGVHTDRDRQVQDRNALFSLESDMEKLKTDLRTSRALEQELRHQINQFSLSDKSLKNELQQVKQKSEQLENKLHNLVRVREQDKQTIQTLEKKLVDEQNKKSQVEKELNQERKTKKAEEAAAARALATAGATRGECNEVCKSRRREMEAEAKQIRRDLKSREEMVSQLEVELQALRSFKEKNASAEVLMSALATMKEKNAHLEKSLSAENRLKVDLFSALGEAKRQLETTQGELERRNRELEDLRRRVGSGDAGSGSGSSTVTPPPQPGSGAGDISMEQTNMYNLSLIMAAAAYPGSSSMSSSFSGTEVGENNGMGRNGLDYLSQSQHGSTSSPDSSFMGNGQISFTPPRTSS